MSARNTLINADKSQDKEQTSGHVLRRQDGERCETNRARLMDRNEVTGRWETGAFCTRFRPTRSDTSEPWASREAIDDDEARELACCGLRQGQFLGRNRPILLSVFGLRPA